ACSRCSPSTRNCSATSKARAGRAGENAENAAHALRVVKRWTAPSQSLDDMEVCASSLELIGRSPQEATTFREALRGPQRGPGCCIRAPTRQGASWTTKAVLLTDLSEGSLSTWLQQEFVLNRVHLHPSGASGDILRSQIASALCLAPSSFTDSGAISALASFTPRLWIGAADLADERDTTGQRLAARQRARQSGGGEQRSGAAEANNLGGNQDCLLVKGGDGLDDVDCTDVAA
uniref:Helicase ATP-binding domain-containing protein n=1 Tax=Macrostomum lignano TaxID=282301 RepID=A0A1I8FJU6_9PLAT